MQGVAVELAAGGAASVAVAWPKARVVGASASAAYSASAAMSALGWMSRVRCMRVLVGLVASALRIVRSSTSEAVSIAGVCALSIKDRTFDLYGVEFCTARGEIDFCGA